MMTDITALTAWSNLAIALATFLLALFTVLLIVDNIYSRKETRKPNFVPTTMNYGATSSDSSLYLINTGKSVSSVSIGVVYCFDTNQTTNHTYRWELPGVPKDFAILVSEVPLKNIIENQGFANFTINYTMVDNKTGEQKIILNYNDIDKKESRFAISIPLQHFGI